MSIVTRAPFWTLVVALLLGDVLARESFAQSLKDIEWTESATVEQMKAVEQEEGVEIAALEPAAGAVKLVDRLQVNSDVLSSSDESAYKRMMKDARAGRAPSGGSVKDPVLMGHVKAAYLMAPGHSASFGELNGWLKEYGTLAQAGDIYKMAEARRERPKQQCSSKKVPVKKKVKGKTKTSTKTVKSCKTVGGWGPAPVKPEAVLAKERKAKERELAQSIRLGKLSDSGRRVLSTSWRARVRGDFSGALRALMAPGARSEAGQGAWQSELVKVASFYHGKRDWANVLKAAGPAADAEGADRDEALWLAGFASYRLGKVRDAADYWSTLVKEEPVGGSHHGRAAWWAARAYGELGQHSKVKDLLRRGATDKVSFYGQLCAERAGVSNDLHWGMPDASAGEVERLKKIGGVRRALALAQVGETNMAQQELRAASEEIPYQLTPALAAVALDKKLPGAALLAGRELLERGQVVGSALFPLPDQWSPRGGNWSFDRALITGIMRQESAFQPSVGSWAGAQGLMQIMPATGAYVARMSGLPKPSRGDLHDPTLNLTLAQNYLNYLSGKLDGNLMMVVAAYNGGVGNVQRWLDRGVTPGDDPVMWLESIPFDETRLYVEKVFANYWIYQQRLGKPAWSLREVAQGNWPLRRNAQLGLNGSGG